MEKLIDDVNRSVVYWVRKEYRKREPQIAMDSAAGAMGKILTRLFKYWLDKWTGRANSVAQRLSPKQQRKTRSGYAWAFKASGCTAGAGAGSLQGSIQASMSEADAFKTK